MSLEKLYCTFRAVFNADSIGKHKVTICWLALILKQRGLDRHNYTLSSLSNWVHVNTRYTAIKYNFTPESATREVSV